MPIVEPHHVGIGLKIEFIRAFKATETGPELEKAKKEYNKKRLNSCMVNHFSKDRSPMETMTACLIHKWI